MRSKVGTLVQYEVLVIECISELLTETPLLYELNMFMKILCLVDLSIDRVPQWLNHKYNTFSGEFSQIPED